MLKCPGCGSDELGLVARLSDDRRRIRCRVCGTEWVRGEATPPPPDRREGQTLRRFVDDDRGYLAWTARWPDGYVLNCERHPGPDYLVLHRARCPSINALQPQAGTFTGEYVKVCSTDRHQVQQWAREHGGADPQWCQLCL